MAAGSADSAGPSPADRLGAGARRLLDLVFPPPDPNARPSSSGWRVIAAKEFADHVTSVRFVVLVIILAVAAVVPLYFASARIRELAPQATGQPAIFLALFTLGSEQFGFLQTDRFVALLAPLLGIAFGFDAVNVERSEGTLPRLLSQPIYRDDVINGKFAAGLAVIGVTLTSLVALIAGIGMYRLGIVPTVNEALRIVAWLFVTIAYVGFWLALATLLSVVIRRAASSALIGFGAWLAIVIFGSLVISLIAGFLAPIPSNATPEQQLAAAQTQQLITRLSPQTLYTEASSLLLSPFDPISAGGFTPATIGQLIQATDQRRIPSLLSIDQSLLLIWPQVVAIIAATVVLFALAYVAFMRQEVRA